MIAIPSYPNLYIVSIIEMAYLVIIGMSITLAILLFVLSVNKNLKKKKAYKASLTDKELRKYQTYLDN